MKYIISFLAGTAVGVVATYLYFNNKIENIVEEKVSSEMEKFFKRQTEMVVPDVIESPDDEPKVSDVPETGEKSSIIEMKEIIKTNYTKPERNDNDGIEEDDDDEDDEYITDEEMEELMEKSRNRMSETPHIITEEERDTCIGYDHSEYIWYPEGNIITDVLDRPVEEPDDLFAPVNWREELKDKEEITIRNAHEATDYIIYNDMFYGKEK